MASKLTRLFQFMDTLGLGERDPFGNPIVFKRIIMVVLGFLTYSRLVMYNKTKIKGTEHLDELPERGVLFLSNHQTYFMDVICLYHIFFSVKWGFRNSVNYPIYLLAPRSNLFYVAAAETMKDDGILPKVFAQAGAILVNRSWRAKGENVKREVDLEAVEKIKKGLGFGWVISFPQGTTRAFAPLRKGTAHLIKSTNPIVVPVRINGFRRAFDKKGLLLKMRNTQLEVEFRQPIQFQEHDSVEAILDKIAFEVGLTVEEENKIY
ncbi:1-acylglycerol-3-phosphate O-acyltransferase [Aquirufa nivalisilvae]|uniref:1-acylglycerol-3-phosphate O-acyltransferase n=1 Tax=Aquirufa nivalisilvae TaxID=2516557 RepID=A0A2S2DRB6_9BACT|nr:lysophospholipid acyltransferase family protein [Aquirufa nivalisilvae]AWL07933.1 1-acylglycerol-3-phosphate O-acyltransferase [Aquirufa nivalisilvae]